MSVVGDRVKERRAALNITMQELAEKTGYTTSARKTAIYNIEADKASIPLARLPAFANALHTNIYYLLGMNVDPDITDSEILSIIANRCMIET